MNALLRTILMIALGLLMAAGLTATEFVPIPILVKVHWKLGGAFNCSPESQLQIEKTLLEVLDDSFQEWDFDRIEGVYDQRLSIEIEIVEQFVTRSMLVRWELLDPFEKATQPPQETLISLQEGLDLGTELKNLRCDELEEHLVRHLETSFAKGKPKHSEGRKRLEFAKLGFGVHRIDPQELKEHRDVDKCPYPQHEHIVLAIPLTSDDLRLLSAEIFDLVYADSGVGAEVWLDSLAEGCWPLPGAPDQMGVLVVHRKATHHPVADEDIAGLLSELGELPHRPHWYRLDPEIGRDDEFSNRLGKVLSKCQ